LNFFNCEKSISQEKKSITEQAENKNSAEKTAIDFIDDYIKYCDDRNPKPRLIEWVSKQKNVSEKFKTELKRIIEEAVKQNAEFGLGFDPILVAQDYPDDGFKISEFDSISNYLTLEAKSWKNFKITMKMKKVKNQWLVHGCGIINIPKTKQAKR
jgi:hypothetical protein